MKNNVGDEISFDFFCYINKYGGTGLSESSTEKIEFKHIAHGVITKAWEGHECGERYWVKPTDDQPELFEFLDKVASKLTPVGDTLEMELSEEYVLFVGEFDIL